MRTPSLPHITDPDTSYEAPDQPCRYCGLPWEDAPHGHPIRVADCAVCGHRIGLMTSCCEDGPTAIWLHAYPGEVADDPAVRNVDHDAEPDPETIR